MCIVEMHGWFGKQTLDQKKIYTMSYAWALFECSDTSEQQIKRSREGQQVLYQQESKHSSFTDMLQDLNWESLELRRKKMQLDMFYKVMNYLVGIRKMHT